VPDSEINELRKELAKVEGDLVDRRKTMPAHSVRPSQLMELEELEDRAEQLKRRIKELESKSGE